MNNSIEKQLKEIKKYSKKFNKFIIWGLKSTKHDSFRYIHAGYYRALKNVGLNAFWVDDALENQSLIGKDDFVFTSNRAESHLRVIPSAYYCFHNSSDDLVQLATPKKRIIIQVYINDAESKTEVVDSVTFYRKKDRVLFQPWATDLLPWEFHAPVFTSWSPVVCWAGSIWNNPENQGNKVEIQSLRQALIAKGMRFLHIKMAPDWINAHFIRLSRFSPTIAGRWQVEHNYLPCRMWKNISYGQLGCTNVKKFIEVFDNKLIYSDNISSLVEQTMSLQKHEYINLVREQQEIVKQHTYLQRALMVFRAYDY